MIPVQYLVSQSLYTGVLCHLRDAFETFFIEVYQEVI